MMNDNKYNCKYCQATGTLLVADPETLGTKEIKCFYCNGRGQVSK